MRVRNNFFSDCKALFIRNFKLSLRSPEALFMCIAMPAIMMWMFVSLFGGAINGALPEGLTYVNFVLPAILILTIGQTASGVTIAVNVDMQKGIIDRFLSMPIYRTSILFAAALISMLKNIISCTVVLAIAFALGFRSSASGMEWLMAIGVILLIMFAFTWLFILLGLVVRSTEVAGLLMVVPMILPYFSSGFAPVESMPKAIAGFARHQPLTPMIDGLRSLFLQGAPNLGNIIMTICWCVIIFAASFALCVYVLHRRTRK